MCTASGRSAHCVIFLTLPCTRAILGEAIGAAVRHNDWRRLWAVLFGSTFQSVQSLLVTGMHLYSMQCLLRPSLPNQNDVCESRRN